MGTTKTVNLGRWSTYGRVELGVSSTSVLSHTWNKDILKLNVHVQASCLIFQVYLYIWTRLFHKDFALLYMVQIVDRLIKLMHMFWMSFHVIAQTTLLSTGQ